jgi:hypothetical protein
MNMMMMMMMMMVMVRNLVQDCREKEAEREGKKGDCFRSS